MAKNHGTAYIDSVRAWSDPNAWVGGVVPGTGDAVWIQNSIIVMDVDVTVSSVTIPPYGYLYLYDVNDVAALTTDGTTQYSGTGNGHTLTITDYVELTHNVGFKAGDDATKGSTLVLNSTTALGGAGNETIRGTKRVTAWNIEVPSGATVDFNSGNGTTKASTTVLNKLSMKGGTVTGGAPTYGAASTLSYEAAETVGTEWTASATTGQGVPQNVTVAAGASLNMGTSASNYTLRGDLSVDGASSALDLSGMDGNLTVEGHMSLGTSGASTLTFTSTEGKGDLIIDGNLTVAANGTISGTQGDLKIAGNFTHGGSGGTFNFVEFNGSTVQSVTGTALTVDSLVVDNSQDDDTLLDGDVTLSSNIDITPRGVFNPVDGSVDIQGTFTMNSDTTGTARIATLANNAATSDVDGDITFERYVPATTDNSWLSIGNYVGGATYGDWSSSLSSMPFWLIFEWDETHTLVTTDAANGANAWSIISSGALESTGIGYTVLTAANNAATFSATGAYNAIDQTQTLTLSNGAGQGGGWHLVSNPFPSPIDGSQFLTDNSGRVSSYYLYDNTTDIFTNSSTNATATIDVGQAFWIQVSSAGDVYFNTSQITHGANDFVRTGLEDQGIVGVRIEQEDGRFGQTFIRFHEDAQDSWDWEYDATFKQSGNNANPEIYSILEDGHKLMVNAPGSTAFGGEIDLVVETGSTGNVSIALDEEFPLPQGVCVLLEDNETGETIGLGGDDALELTLSSNTVYSDRFTLTFMETPLFTSTTSHCEGGSIHFNGESSEDWAISWDALDGSVGGDGCVVGLDPGEYHLEATNLLNQCFTSSSVVIEPVCMGDFNLNGERDITDLLMLLVGIQPVENFEGTFPSTDCDCDGVMTTLDLLMFLPQFGAFCE